MKGDLGFFALTLENVAIHDKICKLINSYIDNRKDNQIVLFNQYCEKINTKNIPILPISYSKYYNGDMIVFDVASLLIAVNSINANNIYFYTQSIPWLLSYNNYSDWSKIFANNRLKVIASSTYINDIFNLVWNNSLGISEDITYEKFSQFI